MNKKGWIILAIILVIIIGSIVGVTALIINLANKTKDPITATKFESIMEEKQFSIINSKTQFEEYDYIKDSMIAMQNDGDYQIEFYVMDDTSNAAAFFKSNKSIFENKASDSSKSRISTTFKNGETFKLNSNGKYMAVSRIDNTVVYVNVDSEYKDSVDDILKDLGY